jgi:hypothetical protein
VVFGFGNMQLSVILNIIGRPERWHELKCVVKRGETDVERKATRPLQISMKMQRPGT